MFQPDGKSKVDNTSAFQIPITSSEARDSINVPYLHPDQPVTYLGHPPPRPQPDENQSVPFQIAITKTKEFSRRIVSTNISRQLVTMTNSSIINPTIKYPLISTCFNDQQIDTIHKSIHPIVIAGMGYSSKWPKALRYDTHKYCSLKFQHFGLEELIQQIDTIHRFINNKNFKHLMTNMIDAFQLASDISIPVLENNK